MILVGLLLTNLVPDDPSWRRVVAASCMDCHGRESAKGKLDLESILADDISRHAPAWEGVVRKLRTRQMPPPGKKGPSEADYDAALASLEAALDAAPPDPGRTDTIRRLTRVEYQNAVRDLLALEVDGAALLPPDESSHGFDSATTGTLSPTVLERYLSAAQHVSRLAVGAADRSPGGQTFRLPADLTQEERVEGLPLGTRGGALLRYTFPRDGDYDVVVRLARDRNDEVEGLTQDHQLEILLDRERAALLTVKPGPHAQVDAHLKARLRVKAGPHDLGVTFLKKPAPLLETLRQPYDAHFNLHRHPRLSPAVYQVSITGPYDSPGDSPGRLRFDAALLRRAWRRPVGDADVARVRREGPLEETLSAVLASHEFLFRVERDPAGLPPATPYRVSDIELASRLSFFLWSSIPDDELLGLAERGELHRPEVLTQQARRLLADPRSRSLVTNFAAQWLQLRALDGIIPDRRLFPDFDDNLRQSMRRETELLFEEIVREDRSVLGLIASDHTFLNQRLAKHYGVPHVYGSRFRSVAVDSGGLLRHGSVLTLTSYATRTSPVLRGKWVLENLIGTPPPPPLPDVPALDDVSALLPVRERLLQHRKNPTCARCHDPIDPIGFALENFDAVGRRRATEDDSGGLPDGSVFTGVDGLEAALLKRPDAFVTAFTEKLLTFALGRGLGHHDAPAVRRIVRAARKENDRFSALVIGIVQSVSFQRRRTP